MERSMHLSPTRCRRTTLGRSNDGKLAGESDESTSDVVVYGILMASSRSPWKWSMRLTPTKVSQLGRLCLQWPSRVHVGALRHTFE